jgi:hypothetical protein
MAVFIGQVLFTASSLLLLLPPNWCSFMCHQAAFGTQEVPKKTCRGCCDLGHCRGREQPPPEPNHPSLPSGCCSFEIDWLKPNPPEKPIIDLSLPTFVVPKDSDSKCVAVRLDPDLSVPGPSPPLHLLKCVWLC